MGRCFVLKRFGGEAERQKVESFLANIHETWTDHLSQIDWLDNQTRATAAQFEEKTKCFIDQYSKFAVAGPNNSTLNVNGALTLAENLADNGGGKLSIAAYKRLNKQEQKLPGLENMSPEALYFVNLGRSWCSKQRDEVAQFSIYVDTHSPPNFRVNGIFQNSVEFANTFNCPAGSPMNPETKCSMW
ncbi:uncharacterized protein ATC70_012565 [Mucor velutinosus]|uniref:Peptidase M13 C-terminal domain-containing protein n=1 Tax=Mucor velutinosus TaxID=708070 RepID=A0AAN7DBD1_9FUNG|nr:hypothetical protein ATC70_012565 [Mucor velutinosus]